MHHVNPTCGDEVTLRVHQVDGDAVADVSYDGQGCSISQASASVMTELVIGRRVEEALAAHEEFLELMQSAGQVEPDEDVLGGRGRVRRRGRSTRPGSSARCWRGWR